ncbi:afadin- and alpha-actinin-binding protein A-like [Periplaneta americana]|uniref:afadin- and alpha-actinin-binding protein A-like n=1 Tax=Periplaneta americana TaxID=6978 RepID=UPI0037E936F6
MSVVMSSSEDSFDLSSSSDSASGDNDILSSIPQLSDELEFFGLRPLPNVKNDGSRLVIQTQVASLVSALIDAVWNLLHLHQSTIRQNDEAEDRRHRLADDNKNLRAQVDRLKTELVGKEKVLSVANEKERRLTSECDKLQTDLRKEKDEVRRLVSQVAQRDSQHIHELRKKENEVLQVQEQLRQNLGLSRVTRHISKQESNKKSPHESCSDNTCDIPAKSRGEPTMSEEQEELYRKVIYKFESNNHSLIQENISLRETYCKLHNELGLVTQQFVVLMEKYFKSTKTSENGEDKNMLKILPSSVFQMPYDGVKEYNKELHLMSDRYVAMLQAVLEKISNYLESQHSI